MKKNFTLIALTLISGSVRADFWDNCTAYGGTIITANSYGNDKSGGLCHDPNNPELTNNCNGMRFCQGPTMNWWSSFTWCESIGGKLVSFEHLCPGTQTAGGQSCPNVKGISNASRGRTSNGWGTNATLIVQFWNGVTANDNGYGGRNLSWPNTLCEEK